MRNLHQPLTGYQYQASSPTADTIGDTRNSNQAGVRIYEYCTGLSATKGGGVWRVDMKILANGAKQFGTDTDNTTIETDGTVKFNGAATVFDDVAPTSVTVGTGVNAPSFTAYNGNLRAYEFVGSGTNIKELNLGFQLPHSYKEGSTITPHIHLFIPDDGTGGVIKFLCEYTWTNVDQTGAVATTTVNGTITRTANAGINNNAILSFGDIVGTGKTISSIFMCRIYRDPADATDTFGLSTWMKSADIHFEKDTIGSRTATAK